MKLLIFSILYKQPTFTHSVTQTKTFIGCNKLAHFSPKGIAVRFQSFFKSHFSKNTTKTSYKPFTFYICAVGCEGEYVSCRV